MSLLERPCFSFGKSSAMAEHCQNNYTKKNVPKTTLGFFLCQTTFQRNVAQSREMWPEMWPIML